MPFSLNKKRVKFFYFLSYIATGFSVFIILAGGVSSFLHFYSVSLLSAITATILSLFPGIFLLLISEGFYLLLSNYIQNQKQKDVLEQLLKNRKENNEEIFNN
jgi:hypothetical protein